MNHFSNSDNFWIIFKSLSSKPYLWFSSKRLCDNLVTKFVTVMRKKLKIECSKCSFCPETIENPGYKKKGRELSWGKGIEHRAGGTEHRKRIMFLNGGILFWMLSSYCSLIWIPFYF